MQHHRQHLMRCVPPVRRCFHRHRTRPRHHQRLRRHVASCWPLPNLFLVLWEVLVLDLALDLVLDLEPALVLDLVLDLEPALGPVLV